MTLFYQTQFVSKPKKSIWKSKHFSQFCYVNFKPSRTYLTAQKSLSVNPVKKYVWFVYIQRNVVWRYKPFSILQKLKKINITNFGLMNIPKDTFSTSTKTQKINLSKNQLQILLKELFDDLDNLKEYFLYLYKTSKIKVD